MSCSSSDQSRCSLICLECSATFTSKFALKRHQNEAHGAARKFSCPRKSCKRSQKHYAFKRESHLQRHLEASNHHQNERSPTEVDSAFGLLGDVVSSAKRNGPTDIVATRCQQRQARTPENKLMRDLRHKYHVDMDAIERNEQKLKRRMDSLEKLLAYLRTLPEQPSETLDPFIQSMWEKYQQDKEGLELEKSYCRKQRASLEKLAAYMASLDPVVEV